MPLIIYLMRNLKFILFILGLLFSFVTMGQDNSLIRENGRAELSGTTATARIISPKAVVYADENMLSPLGYIANGKAITVGNPRRMNRDLVPLVIYGRLAFIEVKDIRYEDANISDDYNIKRGAPREHDVDVTIQQPEERLSENNSAYLTLHQYAAGSEVKNAFYAIEQDDKDTMGGFLLQLIHRPPNKRFFWGAGLDYSSVSTSNMSFGYWMVSPTLGYALVKSTFFTIDIYGSLDLAINSQIEIKTNSEKEPSGYVWGPQVNARLVLFPEAKYHAVGGIGIRKYSVSGYQTLKDANDMDVVGIKSVSGITMFIGLGMEFR